MMLALIQIAIMLAELHGPEGQVIEVNPEQVVSIREPRGVDHFAKGTQCLVITSDGKFITVTEGCESVRQKLREAK